MTIYLVEWFLHVPRSECPTGWDRGRKGHVDRAEATLHFEQLARRADTDGAPIQRVELRQIDTIPEGPDLVIALVDDLSATPRPARLADRRDADRRPWVASARVLRHWRPTPTRSP